MFVDDRMFVIPRDRLPPGFAERIDEPPLEPVEPRPAATVVLVSDATEGPEVLLLRRLRSAGFVPGAYVFPGGTVDDADADPRLAERIIGAAEPGPPLAFWIAAVREVFEETGVLLAETREGADLTGLRNQLLEDRTTMLDIASSLGGAFDLRAMAHIAHWITPVVEPRRYDTHFFLARLPEGATASPDPREMSDALWIAPGDALERFRSGRLPMVFPTVRTLEELVGYPNVGEMLARWRTRDVPTLLPRLVRTEEGVTITLDDDGGTK